MHHLHLDNGRVIPVNLDVDVDILSRAVGAYSRMLADPDRVFDQGWTMTVELSSVILVLNRSDLNALVRSRSEPSVHLAVDSPNGGPSQMFRYVIAYSFGAGDPDRVRVEPSRGLARVRTAHGEVMLSEQHDLPYLRQWLTDNVLVRDTLTEVQRAGGGRGVILDLPGAGRVTFTEVQIRSMATALQSALGVASPLSGEGPAIHIDQQMASPITGEAPRSQHHAGLAMDFAVDPAHGSLVDRQAIDIWRVNPAITGDVVRLPTANGTYDFSRDHDIVNLRAWLIDNARTTYREDEMIVVPLPSGDITFTARQIRAMAAMLTTALAMEGDHDLDAVPTDYPGQPLRAVTNIDGTDYVQGDGEVTPEFEQRVIRDMMLRRGRDMMRDHGMAAEQAAAAVQSMVDRAGVPGLASPETRPSAPARDTLQLMSQMTEDEHRLLAGAVDQWHQNPRLPEPVAALMARLGMTSANMVWMNEQVRFGMENLPKRELRSVSEPTLMETWRD